MPTISPIDEFLSSYPNPEAVEKMQQLHQHIRALSPELEETLNYGIPTYKYKGKNLVHFGPAKKHIGFYPAPSGIREFTPTFEKLGLKYSKGAVQFPLTEPIPLELVTKIVKFRLQEEDAKR